MKAKRTSLESPWLCPRGNPNEPLGEPKLLTRTYMALHDLVLAWLSSLPSHHPQRTPQPCYTMSRSLTQCTHCSVCQKHPFFSLRLTKSTYLLGLSSPTTALSTHLLWSHDTFSFLIIDLDSTLFINCVL